MPALRHERESRFMTRRSLPRLTTAALAVSILLSFAATAWEHSPERRAANGLLGGSGKFLAVKPAPERTRRHPKQLSGLGLCETEPDEALIELDR